MILEVHWNGNQVPCEGHAVICMTVSLRRPALRPLVQRAWMLVLDSTRRSRRLLIRIFLLEHTFYPIIHIPLGLGGYPLLQK